MAITATGLARAGMGRATFDGMFASTLLTLFVVPVSYTMLDDLQENLKSLLKKKRKKWSKKILAKRNAHALR
jgi:hypothetical protein